MMLGVAASLRVLALGLTLGAHLLDDLLHHLRLLLRLDLLQHLEVRGRIIYQP